MAKRRNENGQMRREEYDALEDNDGSDGLKEGFETASADVLKKRRILRVSKSSRFSKGLRPPSSAGATTPLPNATPTPAKKNPFASVSFASATSKGPPSTTPISKFSFASPAMSQTPSRSTPQNAPKFSMMPPKEETAVVPQSPNVSEGAEETKSISLNAMDILNLTLIRMGQMERRANPLSDYSCWLKEYIKKVQAAMEAALKEEEEEDQVATTAATKAVSPFAFASNSVVPPSTKSEDPSPPKPRGLFQFSASAAPAAPSAPAVPPASTDMAKKEESEDTNTPKDPNAKPEIKHSQNDDEEELYTVRAKYNKHINGEWKSFAAGVLRLYRHKTTSKCRVDIRNDIGKVQLSLALPKGMALRKVLGKGKGYVHFHSIQDESEGMKQFSLVVKSENLDKLFDTMTDMTKNE